MLGNRGRRGRRGKAIAGVTLAAALLAGVSGLRRLRDGFGSGKWVLRRYIEIWESGEVDGLHEVVGKNYVGHYTGLEGPERRDRSLLAEQIRGYHKAFADPKFAIEEQLAENDKVATKVTAQARHAQTGAGATMTGITIARIEDGRIAEEWASWDYLGLATRIGAEVSVEARAE